MHLLKTHLSNLKDLEGYKSHWFGSANTILKMSQNCNFITIFIFGTIYYMQLRYTHTTLVEIDPDLYISITE